MGLRKSLYIFTIVLWVSFTNVLSTRSATMDTKDSVDEKIRVIFDDLETLKQEQVQETKEKLIMKDMLEKQRLEMTELKHTLYNQQREITRIKTQAAPLKEERRLTSVKYMRSSFGCEADEIQLACSDGKIISVTHSDYGEYSQPCGEGQCCIPHPFDCTELLSVNDNADWIDLKLTCDNETECTYLFQGSTFVQECTVSGPVSYMNIYYTCLPEDSEGPIGFSAYALEDRSYNVNDIVMFDGITTNLGGNYQSHTSTFLCPVSGVYVLSASLLNDKGYMMTANIMRGNTLLAGLQSDSNNENNRQTGASTVVTECDVGAKIWVQARNDGERMIGGASKLSTFSGFLIHRY